MEYITLRNSSLRVSRLCMGGCPMGGYGWGEVQQEQLLAAVHTAIDAGVTFFDTADTYGLGQSERTLAQALGGKRKDVVIASKFGVCVENGRTFYDNSPAYIERALHDSLERLQTDYIDLYQVHYRDGVTPLEAVVEKLEACKRQGKIRAYGLSNVFEKDLAELREFAGCFSSFQDEYSLACRSHEADIRTLADELKLTPMTWGSLGQGILTGKYDRNCSFSANDRRSRAIYVNFHGEKLEKNLRIVEVLREIAEAHATTPAAAAIRFILDYLPQSVVLVGAKRPEQIAGNVEAMRFSLDAQELAALERVSGEDAGEEQEKA